MNEDRAGDFPLGRWRARWIWFEAPRITLDFPQLVVARAEVADRIGCLRRTFDLHAVPPRVPARVTADSRYILWVNGSEVARGPLRGNSRRLHYDTVDLAPYLRAGRNVIAVLARFYGRPVPWWAPAPPTPQLGGGAFVFEARLSDTQWLLSDDSWRAHGADAWNSMSTASVGNMPLEAFDARRLAAGWNTPDFDDKDWTSAVVLAANFLGFSGRHEPPAPPYGVLQPRPIQQLGRVRREAKLIAVHRAPRGDELADPVEQVRRDLAVAVPFDRTSPGPLPGTVEGFSEPTVPTSIAADALPTGNEHVCVATFDFGEIVSGTVILDVDAPAGTRFDLAAGEFVGPGGVVRQDDERLGLRYVARGTHDRFESFDSLGFRCASIAVRASEPVRLRPLVVCERLYPHPEGPRFACSDPRLEQIWAVGRRTVDLCSHDAYLDCPTREQRAWTGDFVVHQMVDLATSADWRLACWNVELAASPRPDGMLPMAAGGDIEHLDFSYIPDWALHWVRALHNLYRYTGDRELVARLLPVTENVLRWFVPFQDGDGLLTDVTGWVIIDWSSVTTAGYRAGRHELAM